MSPKKITSFAIVIGGISLLGVAPMALLSPEWGVMNWWPAMGLGIAFLLLVVSFLKGAYLATQERVHKVDLLNDCYMGVSENQEAAKR